MMIRAATLNDHDPIWSILGPVIRAGETYALPRDMSRAEALAYWCGPGKACFVAESAGEILGTYYLRPNQQGGGAHVANCGYMTAGHATGRGVARAMATHSLDHAKTSGYVAMQFNCVVSTNQRAIRLWEDLGFETLCRLPRAFEHPSAGRVDALVMFRTL
jgi:ribosomal protein S18 acetylase RimI-like enzyme